jgi:uncharacterized membrane protein
LPLLMPPVIIPAAIAITFGRTLPAGRTPLVERDARLSRTGDPGAAVLRYARRVTWAWWYCSDAWRSRTPFSSSTPAWRAAGA